MTAWRVCSVISNRTGRPVFFCRTVALDGRSVWGNVLDFESNYIATAQLAIDSEIEQGQVSLAVSHLELGADRPDVFWPERRLGSGHLALVPRDALRGGGLVAFHGHSPGW